MQLAFDLGGVEKSWLGRDRGGGVLVNDRKVAGILQPATGMVASYDFTLNPYVGCQFGCSYCYAVNFVADEGKAEDWGKWVDVKSNALGVLMRTRGVAGAKIYVGSVTDPYQPVELETGLTRSLLEHLAGLSPQPKVVIQTRSPIVTRDIEVLKRFDSLRVNMSVTTDDDRVRKEFEPACASIERRLEAVRKLSEAGIEVGVCVSPMLPVTNPEGFARRLRESGAVRFTASTFHRDRGRFAAGTKGVGRKLAREKGWGADEFFETVVRMRKVLPELETKGRGFAPVESRRLSVGIGK